MGSQRAADKSLARDQSAVTARPSRSGTASTLGADHLPLAIVQGLRSATAPHLQRYLGNRAVVGLLGASGATSEPGRLATAERAGLVQRKGGKGKRKRNKGRRRGNGGGNQRTGTQQPTSQQSTGSPPPTTPSGSGGLLETLGSYTSWLWGSTKTGTEGEGDVDGGDINSGGLGHTTGQTHLGGEQDPNDKPKEGDPIPGSVVDQLLNIPKVTIKLEKEFGGGVKGSVGGGVGKEGAKGKAKVEWAGPNEQAETAPVKLMGDVLTGKGSYFRGAKASAEVEGEAGWDDKGGLKVGSKGKIAGFVGQEIKGETEVVVNVGGHETKVKGALGVTLGVGGELSYWLTFEGGKLSWGSKGKAAFGVGAAWEYQLELPVASVSSSLWSWISSGLSGLGSGLMSVGDWLMENGFIGG